MKKKIELSIILCVFNELERLPVAFNNLIESIGSKGIEAEVLIIDNCSTDGTREWIKKLENPLVNKIFNEKNLGKGGSIKRGIKLSKGKYFVIFDPDLEYSPESIWDCLEEIKRTGCQGVLGSRTMMRKVEYHYLINRIGVQFLSIITNLLYGSNLTDTATAVKMFETSFMQSIKFKRNGFNFDFELVCRALICEGRIIDVPVDYFPRTFSEGKKISAFKDGFLSFLAILSDRFRTKSSLWKSSLE